MSAHYYPLQIDTHDCEAHTLPSKNYLQTVIPGIPRRNPVKEEGYPAKILRGGQTYSWLGPNSDNKVCRRHHYFRLILATIVMCCSLSISLGAYCTFYYFVIPRTLQETEIPFKLQSPELKDIRDNQRGFY